MVLCRFGYAAIMAPTTLNILLWHVHGSWTTSIVHGRHRYFLPVLPDRGPFGLGRAGRPWPATATEIAPEDLADTPIDAVILQRPQELALVEQWLHRIPGADLPAAYVEHNTPTGHPFDSVHPLADQDTIPIVHVTHFNQLMWDNGKSPTEVVTHGIPDPGYRYTGTLDRAASMINEPVRRGRRTGADLITSLSAIAPIDVFGIATEELSRGDDRVVGCGDVQTPQLFDLVAQRRVYLHTARWTSLGLSMIEAMFLGMPIVAVASTAAPSAVPANGGVVSADVHALARGLRAYLEEPERALEAGLAARRWAQLEFSLDAFLNRWDQIFDRITG